MTDTAPRTTDPATDSGEPMVAHIVRKEGVTDAYVYGTPIEALCGLRFTPTRDPDPLPVCSACEDVMASIRSSGEN